jgi:HK97 gp10 family phage protein
MPKDLGGVRLEGFDELEKLLVEQLPKATSRAVLQRSGKTAMEPVLERAEELVPVRTGRLKSSIRIAVKFLKASGRFGAAVLVQVGAGDREAYWAKFVERGTVKVPAHPFLRPAFDGEERRIIERLQAAIRVEIDKAVARRAKRLAKRGG